MTRRTQAPIRVLLVDDHRMVTGALSQVLSREPDMELVGVAESVATTRSFVGPRPDVVLMDYQLTDGTGADATRALKARWPHTTVVMLTALADDERILEAIQAGAAGYLTKERAVDEVVAAVRAAHAGEILLPARVIAEIGRRVTATRDQARPAPAREALTPREREVLRALAGGQSSREIATRLAIAPNTLRTHVQNILSKLGAHSKLEAVTIALRLQLVTPGSGEEPGP